MTTTQVNIMILCAFILMLGGEIARGVCDSDLLNPHVGSSLSGHPTFRSILPFSNLRILLPKLGT